MSKVFLSYRRSDSAEMCDRIYNKLVEHFGKDAVFKDIDSIPLGADFQQYIEQSVAQCAVMLVIIGPAWLTVANADMMRRLDDPADPVRLEIEAALRQGIHVIPIAVDGAGIPLPEHLPPSLQPLVRHNGWEVHHDPYFDTDMQRILKTLEHWVPPLMPSAAQAAPDALACPRCRQVDQVRKVSSITASGTPLANRLAPPADPATAIPQPVPSVLTAKISGAIWIALAVLGISCGWVELISSNVQPMTALMRFTGVPVGSAILGAIASLPFVAGCCILGAYLRLSTAKEAAQRLQMSRQYAQAQAEWQKTVAAQTPLWQRAIGRWQKLYYCGRCDGVFLPAEHTSLVPADQIQLAVLLYQ